MSRLAPWLFFVALLGSMLAAASSLPTAEAWIAPKEVVFHFLAGALAVSLVWQLPRGWDRLDVNVGLFALATLASCAVATNPWLAWRTAALTVSAVVVFVWAREHAWARTGALVASTAVALSVGLEAAGVSLPSSMTDAPGGALGSRTAAVLFLSMSAPATVVFLAHQKSRAGRIALASCVVVQGLAAGLTHSTLAALALVGVALGVVLTRAEARRPALLWGVAPLVLAVGAGFVLSPVEPSAPSMGALTAWLPVVRERLLLGVGPGNWSAFSPHVGGAAYPGELGALLLERGFVGAAVAGMLGLSVMRAVRVLVARSGDDGAPLAGVVFTVFACGLLTTTPLSPATLALTAVLLGTALPRTAEQPIKRQLPVRLAVGILVAVLLASSVRSFMQVTALQTSREEGGSLDDLHAAVALDPGNVEYRLQLAETSALACDCATARAQLVQVRKLSPWHSRTDGIDALCQAGRCDARH